MNNFGEKVLMYFLRWKSYVENYNMVVKKKHKERIINRYKTYLKDALNIWKNNLVKKRKRKVLENISEFNSETHEVQNEIR